MQTLTDSMFYILMALSWKDMCGKEITDFISSLTDSRIEIGPATLYTILSKFLKEGMIEEIAVEGRKRTYSMTAYGRQTYIEHKLRIQQCMKDAERMEENGFEEKDAPLSLV